MKQVIDFFTKLFDSSDWPPRWHCGQWTDFHGWLYIISDLLIWSAYFSIPIVIIRYISRKQEIRFTRLYFLFAAFILACGATHFLDAVAFWIPLYRFSALMRFITGALSWATVFYLVKNLPLIFSLKPQGELEREIEQRKKTEEKFKGLLEAAPDAMVIADEKGDIILINKQTEKLFGYERNELLGKLVEILVPVELHHEHVRDRTKYFDEPKVRAMGAGLELYAVRKDTTRFPVEISISPLVTEEGVLISASIRDITERKKAEEKLKKARNDFQLLVSSIKDYAIYLLDENGLINSWNAGAAHIKGYKAEEVIGRPVDIFYTPEELEKGEPKHNLQMALQFGHYETEGLRVRKDGTTFFANIVFTSLVDEEGKLIGYAKVTRDITEKRKAEESIRFLASIAHNIQDPLITIDNNSVITRWNNAAEQLLGWKSEEVIGKTAPEILNVFYPYQSREQITESFKANGFWQGEVVYHDKSGAPVNVLSTVSYLKGADGIITGSLVLVTDISKLIKAEEELSKLNQELSYQNLEKEKLAAELTITNKELAIQNEEKERRTADLIEVNAELKKTEADLSDLNVELEQRIKERTLKLENSEAFNRGVLNSLSSHIAVVDSNGNIVSVNESWKKFATENGDTTLQRTGEGTNYYAVCERSSENGDVIAAAVLQGMKDVMEEKQVDFYLEYPCHTPNVQRWFNMRIMKFDTSEPMVVVAHQDITQRKKAEDKVKESEFRYRSLIEQASDAIFIVDTAMKYIDINPAGCQLTGYSKEEFLQLSPIDLVFEEYLETNLISKEKLQEGKVINYERRLKRKDGTAVEVEASAKMMEDEKVVVFSRDISDRNKEKFQKMLLAEISWLFNEPGTLNEILQKVVEKIVMRGNFDLAECWLVERNKRRINMVTRFIANESTQTFYLGSDAIKSFTMGEGLPGITWQTKTVQCWRNIDEDKKFVRWYAAKISGLRSVYGLPLIHNDDVIGTIVLGLNKDVQEQDHSLPWFESLGIHTGAEIKRKQLEHELNQIFSFAPDLIAISGFDGYFKKINPAACKMLEYTEDELMAAPLVDFIHQEDRGNAIERIQSLNRDVVNFNFENRFITKSGKIKWLAWTVTASPEERLMFAVAKDITEKKELENRLTRINNLARIGSWEGDPVNKTVYWSDIIKNLHEVEASFVPDFETAINFFKEGKSRETLIEKVQGAIEKKISWDEELEIVTAKGNERWIRTIGETEFANGKCVRIYGSFQDIDQRKKVEIELQRNIKSLEDYRFAIDQSSILAITDSTGVITYINDNFCKISKYSRQELIGGTHRIISSGYHTKEFFKEFWITISSGKVWRGEIKNKAKDGTFYWVYTTVVPFLDDNGKPVQYLAIRFDISEKKLAEENVIKTLIEKNTILESIGDAFFAVDKNWIVTYWNRVAETALGTPKSKIIGKKLWDVFSNSIDSESYKKYHQAIETNQGINFEDYFEPLSRWYEISAYPSDNGLSVYFKDITERKKTQEAILLSNERYNMVAKATSEAIWDWNIITGETNRSGDGFSTLFGYEKKQVNEDYLFWSKLVHPEDISSLVEKRTEIFNDPNESYWEAEYRFLKANGCYTYVYDKGYIIRDENGKAVRMIGATRDISEQKEHTNEITRIQQNLDSLINTTSDRIWSIDPDFKIITANKAFNENMEFFTGRPLVEGDEVLRPVFGRELVNKWMENYEKALSGESFSIDEKFSDVVTGEAEYAIISFSPIRNKDGGVTGVACFSRDITELKKSADKIEEINLSLQKKAEELASSNADLEQFAYVASHDLQEPLRMITSFLTKLEKKYEDVIDSAGKKYIHFAVDGAKRMRQIILDLLEFSRVGRTEDDKEDLDLNELVNEIQILFRKQIEEKGAIIQVGQLPVISTYKTPMRQVFQNLIGNALKYSRNDMSVQINISAIDLNDHWQFAIADNGIGIDEEYFDKIFVIFQRLHNKNQYSGTGMGLAVTKKIVENFGGKIWVDSIEGKGSTFYFSLPKN